MLGNSRWELLTFESCEFLLLRALLLPSRMSRKLNILRSDDMTRISLEGGVLVIHLQSSVFFWRPNGGGILQSFIRGQSRLSHEEWGWSYAEIFLPEVCC